MYLTSAHPFFIPAPFKNLQYCALGNISAVVTYHGAKYTSVFPSLPYSACFGSLQHVKDHYIIVLSDLVF